MEFPNWFERVAHSFAYHLTGYVDQPGVQALQIGAYTGDASVWLLDHILTGSGSVLIDVDTWAGTENEQIHASLDWSEAWDLYRSRMRHRSAVPYRMTSDQFFDFVEPKGQFDFVYVDGDHRSDQVWRDALNADTAVKIGGVIAFDDYLWNAGHNDVPRVAIDRFLGDHGSRYELLEHGIQVWLRKVSERP